MTGAHRAHAHWRELDRQRCDQLLDCSGHGGVHDRTGPRSVRDETVGQADRAASRNGRVRVFGRGQRTPEPHREDPRGEIEVEV